MTTAVTAPERRIEPAPPARPPVPVRRMTAWFFLFLVAYQAFHDVEHTIELVQLQFLDRNEARTLLNGIDFEWLHFGANALLLYGLVAVVIGAGPRARARWRAERRWGWGFMVAALVVQGYHVIDHSVRLVEYVASGGDEPGGTLTQVVNPVWFHWAINTIVLVGMVAAFVGLRLHRVVLAPRRRGGRADDPVPVPAD